MAYTATECGYKDQRAVALESDALRFMFLPGFGANLCSAVDKATGKEFMVQRPEKNYRSVPFDGPYVEGECSGMDDMLPTIDVCYYEKQPWAGVKLADHGEVWNLAADVEMDGESVCCTFHGVRLPYILQKHIRFTAPTVLRIDYALTNPTQFDMEFLWAAHTMLNAEPGVRIRVPGDATQAVATFTNTGYIGKYGDIFPWPEYVDANGVTRKIDVMGPRGNCSEKYYFKDALTSGWCAAHYPDDSVFALSFPADKVPYLGVLHNTGAFRDIYNLFLEPCTASFDRPDIAAVRGQSSFVAAKSAYKWFLNITIEKKSSVEGVLEDGSLI